MRFSRRRPGVLPIHRARLPGREINAVGRRQYGFVRDPVETAAGIIYTRLHEGIDIRPLQRDARRRAARSGARDRRGRGRPRQPDAGILELRTYVVVEHRWDGCKYYSLYGHLSSIEVQGGQRVEQRDQLGVMGHTGDGLNQARAHVHLELNLMLSRQFESWHDTFFKNDPNRHGLYNGLNLVGIDIARLYLALQKRPALTIPEFLAEEETLYRVLVPGSRNFDLAEVLSLDARGKNRREDRQLGGLFQSRGGAVEDRAGDETGSADRSSLT